MPNPVKDGATGGYCGVPDPKRRAWCFLPTGHDGRHQDSWGKRFSAPEPAPLPVAETLPWWQDGKPCPTCGETMCPGPESHVRPAGGKR